MKLKKCLTIILSFLLLTVAIPLGVFTVSAAGYSGSCGENVTWSFNTSSGVLTISGSGEMSNYENNRHFLHLEICGINSVIIENGVTSIGDYAFYKCSSLKSVTIPDSVTSIGKLAFAYCRNLTSVTIGNSVTDIGEHAFDSCIFLSSITFSNSVTEICGYAFHFCNALTSVVIPDFVTYIGDFAFGYCRDLTSVTIGRSVTDISSSAFNNSPAIESISVDSGNAVYHSDGNCLIKTASKTLIAGCKNSIIPADGSATSIGERAFRHCTSLTSLDIPDFVTEIGKDAFSNCTSLESINLPGTLTAIGDWAFTCCERLSDVVIPDSVTSIGEGAFSGCAVLENIIIPDSVDYMDKSAFQRCAALVSVTIGNSVTSIEDYTFYCCEKLKNVILGKKVEYISALAFAGCQELESITVEGGNSVYYSCGNCIIDSANKTLIHGCKSSVIPADGSVTKIGENAFLYCRKLTSIVIPADVNEIDVFAFSVCDGLTDVFYTGTEQQRAQMTINNDYECNSYLINATWHYNYVPHTYGDINGDDKVNNKDLTRFFQYLSNWDVEVNEAALDINGDGKVNNKDLTRLFQYLSNWDVKIF